MPEPGAGPRTGVWLVGARGSVATTTVVGAAAVGAGLAEPTGCVTASEDFPGTRLPPLGALVFGGHDTGSVPLPVRAAELAESGVVPQRLLEPLEKAVVAADQEIRPGYATGRSGLPQAVAARALAVDIEGFRRRLGLDRVVVVNVASTEAPVPDRPEHHDLDLLEAALRGPADVLPASSLYAYAAFTADCPYVDFTPSTGARLPALDALARARGLPYAGSDAKTGETLVQSVLAPMFAVRALKVRAWSGTNLLGGGDGATLADPGAAASKTASKRRGLGRMLGHPVEGSVHIDCVPALGEWKTAWDHVAFEGFLGARMSLQFTWQGCDSALAAPLVLDLVRLTATAHAAGVSGPLGALGFFFKDPVGSGGYALTDQYEALRAFAAETAAATAGGGPRT
ncbi:inositol-3-phosphate synthase [Kitasatospora sp. MY 5-36]|uniref:inositol-3-phosphate synthase n=1 Tax=Kitasatospora sp. MY 5-36 TaxID=1678027 RepID=UPI000670DF86|nr:inositol-3-phosphate synthase [Kitasatospora sp. MY 5-36]